MPKDEGLIDNSLLEGEDHEGVDDVSVDLVADETAGDEALDSPPEAEHDLEVELEAGDDLQEDTPVPQDDLQGTSKNVRERIERERRISRDERARADAANARALKAERESLASQKEALEVTEGALAIQIEAVKAQLVKAKDDGKTTEEVDLQQKLNKLASRQEGLEQGKASLAAREEELKRGPQASTGPNRLAEEWKRRNQWFGNARFGEQTKIAAIIDGEMATAGYDKLSPDYFEELDRRIKRRLPEVQRFMGRPKPKDQPRREPTGGAPRGGPVVTRTTDGKRKLTLSSADQRNMVQFGLDPKNKEHALEYARNKAAGGQ